MVGLWCFAVSVPDGTSGHPADLLDCRLGAIDGAASAYDVLSATPPSTDFVVATNVCNSVKIVDFLSHTSFSLINRFLRVLTV